MHTTQELMRALKARLGCRSDYRLALELGVSRATVSTWKRGRAHPGDDIALDIAEILDLDPGYVLACLAAERAESPAVKKAWQQFAKGIAATAIILLLNLPTGGAGAPLRVGSQPVQFDDNYNLYITRTQ